MIFKLAANFSQQVVLNPAFDQRSTKAAMGCLIGHVAMQLQPAKQHEVEPHLQGTLQFWVAKPMPLADQKAFEQYQRITALRPCGPAPERLRPRCRIAPKARQVISASTFVNASSAPI